MNGLTKFFILCSGANLALIKRSPTEYAKYSGIGITILFTGIFAGISASYSIYSVFDNLYTSIIFGILWGLMIFNLDRYIVSSIRKEGKYKKEFFSALPRIILALLIAIVISKPLELKIFQKEIDSELITIQQAIYLQQDSIIKERYHEEIDLRKQSILSLQNESHQLQKKRDDLYQIAQMEADGTGGTGKKNPGPIYKIKKENADRSQQEYQITKLRNDSLIFQNQKEIDSINRAMVNEIAKIEKKQFNGIAARLEALDQLSLKSKAIRYANWFILLLFIAIETAPIFVKLVSDRGPYDELLFELEHRYITEKARKVSIKNSALRKSTKNLIHKKENHWFEKEINRNID